MPVILGCIADDLAGANDLATALAERGHAVTQFLGAPHGEVPAEADVVVVALRLERVPAPAARLEVRRTARWFAENGVDRLFSAYRGSFECRPQARAGEHVGPIADELLTAGGARLAVHAPSYPARGHTVYQGHGFVGSRLLGGSGAEPADASEGTGRRPGGGRCDPDLVRVLRQQTAQRVALVPLPVVAAGPYAVAERLSELVGAGVIQVIVDAVTDGDLDSLAAACCDGPVLAAGGTPFGAAYGAALALTRQGRLAAGFLSPAARAAAAQVAADEQTVFRRPVPPSGRGAVLVAGSSQRTRDQVAAFEARHPVYQLSPDDLRFDQAGVLDVAGWAGDRLRHGPVMISLDARPDGLVGPSSQQALGEAARRLLEVGVTRLVVAGPEAVAAVTSALGISRFRVGPAVLPGAAWTITENGGLAMVLVPEELGGPAFFDDAFAALGDHPHAADR